MKNEETEFNDKVKLNLRKAIEHYQYTRRELADVLGISKEEFDKILIADRYMFTLLQLQKIADEFFLSIDDLINFMEDKE